MFVTATLVPENWSHDGQSGPRSLRRSGISGQPQPAGQEFKDGLAEALKKSVAVSSNT